MEGLVLSLELIQFLNWLIENRKDLLDSIIKSAAQDKAFMQPNNKVSETDSFKLHQTITKILRTLEEAVAKYVSGEKVNMPDLLNELVALESGNNFSGQEKVRMQTLKKEVEALSYTNPVAKA